MKKLVLVFAAIGFVAMSFTTTTFLSNDKAVLESEVKSEHYKACIDACNVSIASSKKVLSMCTEKTPKMAECEKLCKECIASCESAIKSMESDSKDAKSECLKCAKACEKCAVECEKMDMAECKKCASDCRKTAKLCNEMK